MSESGKTKHSTSAEIEELRAQVAKLEHKEKEHRRVESSLHESINKLEKTKKQYEAVLRSTPHGLCLLNGRWQIVWANRSLANILNPGIIPKKDVIGEAFETLFPSKAQCGEFVRSALAAMRSQGVFRNEVELVKTDGSPFWCEVSVVRHDPAATASGVAATITDLTERRRAEAALRDREKRFRSMVQNSMDMLMVFAPDGKLAYANPVIERDLGYKPGDLMGRDGLELLHPEDAPQARRFLKDLRSEPGKSATMEFRIRHRDGSWRVVEGVCTNLIEDPSVSGVVANVRDVTERKKAERALKDSEAQYESLVESLTQNVFRKGLDGKFTFVNSNFCRTVGRTREQLIGKTDFDFFPDELAEKYRQDDLRVTQSGQNMEVVEEHVTPEGYKLYVQVVKTAVRDASGQVVGIQGIFWDITERIQSEAAIREAEERYRSFIENLPVGVYRTTTGLDGHFLNANPAMARMFGYDSVAEFMNCKVSDLYADAEEQKNFAKDLVAKGHIFNSELRLRKKDGTVIWGTNSTNIKRDAQGRIEFFDGVIQDITERRLAQDALVQSQEKYRNLLENITDGLYEVDLAGNLVYANPALIRALGYTREEFVGKNNRDYMGAETSRQVFDAFNDVFRTGEPHHGFIYELIGKHSDRRTVEGSISLVRNRDGEPIGFQGVIRDITERKKAEEALAEKTRLLERVNQDLIRKNTELDEFTYIASHDLQEPLRKLCAFTDILKKDLGDALPDRAKRDMGFITDASNRMQTLVQDLLQLSRAGKSAMRRERVPLRECAKNAMDALAIRIKETGAEIKMDELPEIWGDRTMLTQLYQNLIGNALKFIGDKKPELHLTCEKKGEDWLLGVKDNGIGIKEEYREQIFAPFKRLHGRDKYEGSGIGLAICRKCVERHGGTIWVESEPGNGAHFKFTIGERLKER